MTMMRYCVLALLLTLSSNVTSFSSPSFIPSTTLSSKIHSTTSSSSHSSSLSFTSTSTSHLTFHTSARTRLHAFPYSKDLPSFEIPQKKPDLIESDTALVSRSVQTTAYINSILIFLGLSANQVQKSLKLSMNPSSSIKIAVASVLSNVAFLSNTNASLMAFVLYCGSKNNWLSSNNYKRLNLTVSLFSLFSILSILLKLYATSGAAVGGGVVRPGISALFANTYTFVIATNGFIKGVIGSFEPNKGPVLKPVLKDLLSGLKNTSSNAIGNLFTVEGLPFALASLSAVAMLMHDVILTAILAKKHTLTSVKLAGYFLSMAVSFNFYGLASTLADSGRRSFISKESFRSLNLASFLSACGVVVLCSNGGLPFKSAFARTAVTYRLGLWIAGMSLLRVFLAESLEEGYGLDVDN